MACKATPLIQTSLGYILWVPRKVIWWALRKLGVEEWVVRLVQGMYANARSRVRVGEGYSEEFEVKVGVHQGSVLSLLLFIIVLEALSREFHSGVPWEDLYADDLVIIAESLEECVRRLLTWKEAMESKCRKDKDHDLWYRPGPPADFRRVSMRRLLHWSGQQQHLLQWLQALDAQEMQWAQALEKGPWLQMYMVPGNCTPLGWQTTEGSPGRTWQAWGGSFLLLPRRHALSSRWLWTLNHNTCENRLEVQGSATSSLFTPPLFQNMWPCVQLLCAETWPLTKLNLQRNVRAMIRQICNVRPQDIVTTRSNELLVRLGIEDLDFILKERRLRWYGHVEHSNGAVKTAFDIQVDGKRGPGRPKLTWKQLTERDCREWMLSAINPHDRHTWRSGVRSAMHAASQLSGRGPTDVDVAPVPAR